MTDETYERYVSFIRSKISKPELLVQLAEEATELAHAALKLHRVIDKVNVTPVPYKDAYVGVIEELADVLLCANVCGFDKDYCVDTVEVLEEGKLLRWFDRLGGFKDDKES